MAGRRAQEHRSGEEGQKGGPRAHCFCQNRITKTYYYLRGDPKGGAPEDQHKTAPNAHLIAPWPMELGWGVSGDNLFATFVLRLCVYGHLLAPPDKEVATGIGL